MNSGAKTNLRNCKACRIGWDAEAGNWGRDKTELCCPICDSPSEPANLPLVSVYDIPICEFDEMDGAPVRERVLRDALSALETAWRNRWPGSEFTVQKLVRFVYGELKLSGDEAESLSAWAALQLIEGQDANGVKELLDAKRVMHSMSQTHTVAMTESLAAIREADVKNDAETLYVLDNGWRTVRWKGDVFQFNPKQASVVKMLAESGAAIPDRELLVAADSDGKSLRDVFRQKQINHAAWGTLIVPAGKGRRELVPKKIQKPNLDPS